MEGLSLSNQQPASGAKISLPPVHRITIAQAVILFVIWVGLSTVDTVVALSFMLGGLIAVVPQAWFAYRVFKMQGARAMQQIARNSYAAEIGKFVMAVTGFMLVFAMVRPIEGWAVFASYGVMLVIQIIGAWLLLRNSAAGNS
jgi:ATP synthase protein I